MKKSVFMSGIGGIGMANVAVLIGQAGYEVTGSDGQIYEPAATILRNAGISAKSPYAESNLPNDGTPIIVGNVQSRGHVEVEGALNRGMTLYSFPEFLSRFILAGRHTIVVAGTHGKSTTTACLSHLLATAEMDPGFLIGALPMNFPVGGRIGGGSPFVIEGDEYDSAFFDKRSKFLHYFPHTLILGTVEYDHADIFPSMDELLLSFRRLINLLPGNGTLIFAADCEETARLARLAPCATISVGSTDTCDWQLLEGADELTFRDPAAQVYRWEFDMPGRHNRMNALMSLAAAESVGVDRDACQTALASFRGLRRRLEKLHESPQRVIYDDFAHHPTAIASAIQAMREKFPVRRLIVICEPRSNTMVRNVFQRELESAFTGADEVLFGSIHRQDRIPPDQRLDIGRLIHHLESHGIYASQLPNSELLAKLAARLDSRPTAYLFLSNGSFDNIPHEFARRISV